MNKEAVAEFETYLKMLPDAKDAEAIRKEISDMKNRPNVTKYAPA
jgi:regulator of sirC expression with transglutaminase-like and TPR domain